MKVVRMKGLAAINLQKFLIQILIPREVKWKMGQIRMFLYKTAINLLSKMKINPVD